MALICVGAILLLSNLGYLPTFSWDLLWRLCPLIPIGTRMDALIGRRSTRGSVVGTLLFLALLSAGVTPFSILYNPWIPPR